MTHVRQQIREAVVTIAQTTGRTVYDSRLWELEDLDLPCWVISTSAEDVEESELTTMGPNRTTQRALRVRCSGVARAQTGLQATQTLDLMAEELETVLTRSALRALIAIQGWLLVSTTFDNETDESDQILQIVQLDYRATYMTADGAPGAIG